MDEGTCTTPVHLDREVGTAEKDCYMRFIFLLFIKWCNLQSYGAYRIKCRIVILLSLAMLSGVIEAQRGQLIPDSEKVIFS